MKPERLQMSGFAPFRELTEVDFTDLELFALTGPTGSGKSSVIDAMTFALYGSVPRHDRRTVEPIISLGMADARIRFDFEVGDTAYTAARVVRRTKTGATTAEARLEASGEVLASGAAEVTRAVENLLGLSIDHFTRSVVLPQGEFAAFLHDKPSGQQDLIKALLDMGVLDVVGRLASERARTATALADAARARLEPLADATEEAETTAFDLVGRLEKLVQPVEDAEAAIVEADAVVKEKADVVSRLTGCVELVTGVKSPAGVAELASALAGCRGDLDAASQAVAAAGSEREAADEASRSLPTREILDEAAAVGRQLLERRALLDGVELDRLETGREEAQVRHHEAKAATAAAESRMEDAGRRHAVHVLLADSGAGDPCPICLKPLDDDPETPPVDLDQSRQASDVAKAALERAVDGLREADNLVARAKEEQSGHAAALEGLVERRAGLPADDAVDSLRVAREAADTRLQTALSNLERCRERETDARNAIVELEDAERTAWESVWEARDHLGSMGPPALDRTDLVRAWDGLTTWADTERSRLAEELTQVRAEAEAARESADKQRAELAQLLEEATVTGSGSPSARLAAAVATARARAERITERRKEREALTVEIAARSDEAAVANTLGNHLRSNRFEGWLLAEALATLVGGANDMLAELTSDAYSLAVTDRNIEVVDHRNADERRPVRSLSGGETFLVSLALALSLGEQLTALSERGGARLDAIFLDEGFGTLDAETLDTVTSVVAELASRGRMVGVVTHVRELAEQIPVRFEVCPGPGGSTIRRVAA